MNLILYVVKYSIFTYTEPTCAATDQLCSQVSPDCVPTCNDPYPSCSGITHPGCICPNGTVLDNIQNKYVALSKYSKNIRLVTNHNIFILSILLQNVLNNAHMNSVLHN